MGHLFQVGAGSGGMPVLDMLCRDPRITHVTLIEPDIYKPHNLERHLFPSSAIGQPKAEVAEQWLKDRRPDLSVQLLICDVRDAHMQPQIEQAAAQCDLGICAADNEVAKFHFDGLMRRHKKCWTLGEVLSGGIGGFVHWFVPDGPCYGCVASHLQRTVEVDKSPPPDYSLPGGPIEETTVPAPTAAIHAIASLHAVISLELLDQAERYDPGFNSLLWTLKKVPDVFEDAFRPYRFRIARSPACLMCRPPGTDARAATPENLDVALDQERWRDWAVTDLWRSSRISPQPQTMHYSYEKAGLTLDNQPIPWNAEAVIVECLFKLPTGPNRRKAEFSLRLPQQELVAPEFLRYDDAADCWRLFFRVPTPPKTIGCELVWRNRVLDRATLPVVTRDEFLSQLSLQMPTLAVVLGEQTVACQTFVASQCRGLVASVLVSSPTSLVPLVDLGLRVELSEEKAKPAFALPVPLSSSQLRAKQALITVAPPKFPRRVARWKATWLLGDQPLMTQHIRGIARSTFQRSLRVSETRIVTQDKANRLRVERQMPPRDQLTRAGPCFLVSSNEAGMAGRCSLQVYAQLLGNLQRPLLMEQELLVTDGPTPLAPGTLDIDDLATVTGFELKAQTRSLGVLALAPVPTASFTSEGGYKPPPEFTWSAVAEEQLADRLSRLMEQRGN